MPVQVSGISTAIAVAAGYRHSCAVLADHTARCWGVNFAPTPVAVSGVTSAVSITAGTPQDCVITTTTDVECWSGTSTGVGAIGTKATAISAGESHTCAVTPDSAIVCWGDNSLGGLGNNTQSTSSSPVTAQGISSGVAVGTGNWHTCAALADHSVMCWGGNGYGQLGVPVATVRSLVPIAQSDGGAITDAVAIASGESHSCALLTGGGIKCWGWNGWWQLSGSGASTSSPVTVAGISTATAITAGVSHTCALLSTGIVACWGSNSLGQGGDPTYYDNWTPHLVGGLGSTPPTASITALPAWKASTAIAVSWGAAAGSNAVDTYAVRYRRAAWNGTFGAYVAWKGPVIAKSAAFTGLAGSTYCFSAQATDTEKIASAWTSETCTAVPLDDRGLARTSTWTAKAGSAYFAGTYVTATVKGARLTRTGVWAKQIALVVTTCKGCGSLGVYWNGVLVKTVSLASATTVNKKLVTVASWPIAKTGTLVLKVSTSAKKVIVDGVVISRS